MYWNNVETKPGVGYPRGWEDNDARKGGWHVKDGKLKLKAGGKVNKLLNIFYNQNLVQIDEYYEPWTYDYENLVRSEEHTSELQSRGHLVCRLLLEKKKKRINITSVTSHTIVPH